MGKEMGTDRQKASLVDTDKEHNDVVVDDENNNHDEWQYVGKLGGQRGNMAVFWLYER